MRAEAHAFSVCCHHWLPLNLALWMLASSWEPSHQTCSICDLLQGLDFVGIDKPRLAAADLFKLVVLRPGFMPRGWVVPPDIRTHDWHNASHESAVGMPRLPPVAQAPQVACYPFCYVAAAVSTCPRLVICCLSASCQQQLWQHTLVPGFDVISRRARQDLH